MRHSHHAKRPIGGGRGDRERLKDSAETIMFDRMGLGVKPPYWIKNERYQSQTSKIFLRKGKNS